MEHLYEISIFLSHLQDLVLEKIKLIITLKNYIFHEANFKIEAFTV